MPQNVDYGCAEEQFLTIMVLQLSYCFQDGQTVLNPTILISFCIVFNYSD